MSTPPAEQHQPDTPIQRPDPAKVAVLLNRNARRVNDKLARKMARIVGRDNLFYSRSLEEAESCSREIVQQGYGTVICGGGDGTFVQTLNMVHHYIGEANTWRSERHRRFGETQPMLQAPRFGLLKLGTGNALKQVVGAGAPLRDLQRLVNYAPGRTHRVALIGFNEQQFLFGGLGYDSMLLNDYNWLKNRTRNALLRPFMHTVLGYFAAVFARTLPAALFNSELRLEARVVTNSTAYFIDPRRGDRSEPLPAGTVLFEGPTRMLGFGTTQFYGFGLRIFPFAGILPGMMHVRIAQLGPVGALSHLPTIWRGHYRNAKRIQDFLADDVTIELERPFPFQHSGEAQGLRDRLDLKISQTPLDLVDFYPPRRVS